MLTEQNVRVHLALEWRSRVSRIRATKVPTDRYLRVRVGGGGQGQQYELTQTGMINLLDYVII